MKRLLLILMGLIFLCFFLPAILTNKYQEIKETSKEENTERIQPKIETRNKVKLLHTKTGEVEEILLEEYLYGVVAAEMPATYHIEALKAQATVARTYTLYKMQSGQGKHEGADICDSSLCCQAWINKEDRLTKWDEKSRDENWNKIVESVVSTQGKIITYEGKPINAFFHSNSGGATEIPFNVWGGSNYPYLKTVETAGEDAYSQYQSEAILSKDEVIEKIKVNHPDIKVDWTLPDPIQISERTESGRVKTIRFGNTNISGVEARTVFGLKSANFQVNTDDKNVIFSVIGYGHGVGMSQTGADSLANTGKNYEEIIHHFYSEVEIQNIV